jgi:ketosteroid isomerase-like protein
MGAAEVDRLRTLYANWSRGDFRSDASLFGPGVEWRQSRDAVEPGLHRGTEEVARMTRSVFDIFEDFRVEPVEFVDAGERVVVEGHIHGSARGSGMELDRPYILVWTFRDGELVRVEEFVTREEALAAVGLE